MVFMFKLAIYVRLRVGTWQYSWTCFILLAALIVRIVLINSFADEVNTPSALVKTSARVFFLALICSILFKLDGLSDMGWGSVFW